MSKFDDKKFKDAIQRTRDALEMQKRLHDDEGRIDDNRLPFEARKDKKHSKTNASHAEPSSITSDIKYIDVKAGDRILFGEWTYSGKSIDKEITPESFAIYASDVILNGAPKKPGIHQLFLDALINKLPGLSDLSELKDEKESSAVRIKSISMPEEPPVLWQARSKMVIDPKTGAQRLQNATEFLEDVYSPWRGSLTRNWLRKHDNSLFQALYRKHGAGLHPDFPLPSMQELNDHLIDQIKRGEVSLEEHLGKFTAAEAAREGQRVASLIHRRSRE